MQNQLWTVRSGSSLRSNYMLKIGTTKCLGSVQPVSAKWIKTSQSLTWQMAQLSELHNQLPCVLHVVIWDPEEPCVRRHLKSSGVGALQNDGPADREVTALQRCVCSASNSLSSALNDLWLQPNWAQILLLRFIKEQATRHAPCVHTRDSEQPWSPRAIE